MHSIKQVITTNVCTLGHWRQSLKLSNNGNFELQVALKFGNSMSRELSTALLLYC